MKQEFARGGILTRLLLGYTHSLITQMTQIAACNRHHSLEQQLCRFLLLTLDRVSSSELVMTQELVAGMLGVRREGVTEAAGNLNAPASFATAAAISPWSIAWDWRLARASATQCWLMSWVVIGSQGAPTPQPPESIPRASPSVESLPTDVKGAALHRAV